MDKAIGVLEKTGDIAAILTKKIKKPSTTDVFYNNNPIVVVEEVLRNNKSVIHNVHSSVVNQAFACYTSDVFMSFQKKVDTIIQKNNSLVCVGLDSQLDKLPVHIQSEKYPQYSFNKSIIDATHDLVCAYKPNSAFYEAQGHQGIQELQMTCEYIRTNYPDIPIIIDAKRGDIGNTNNEYVRFVFSYLQANAITVMPYMGIESLAPFFTDEKNGIIIGCHSSNAGAKELQDLLIGDTPLYCLVAKQIMKHYGNKNNCLIFMGATFPDQLRQIRKIVGDMTFLVPGVGAQAGDIEQAVTAGINSKKQGMIINSSRGIIFASNGTDFAKRAREETHKLQAEINAYR